MTRFMTRQEYLDTPEKFSNSEMLIGGQEIMQDWERPIMQAMAIEVARSKGHVLEVGFGMGISASYILEAGCSEYTVIEPHPAVLERLRAWKEKQPIKVNIVEGFWEDVIDGLGEFDGVFFDTYPVTEAEANENTLIRQFMPYATAHLRAGGVFTFYGSYAEKLPAEDVETLKGLFSSVETKVVRDLEPPSDCLYYHSTSMLVPVCVK